MERPRVSICLYKTAVQVTLYLAVRSRGTAGIRLSVLRYPAEPGLGEILTPEQDRPLPDPQPACCNSSSDLLWVGMLE